MFEHTKQCTKLRHLKKYRCSMPQKVVNPPPPPHAHTLHVAHVFDDRMHHPTHLQERTYHFYLIFSGITPPFPPPSPSML